MLDGLCDRLDLGIFLGQAHDLGPVRRRAHPGLDLAITIQDRL